MATGHADATGAPSSAWHAGREEKDPPAGLIAAHADAIGVIVIDARGRILSINAEVLRMVGLSRGGEHRHLREIASEVELRGRDDIPLTVEQWPLTRALRGEPFARLYCRIIHTHSGQEHHAMCAGHPVYDAHGDLLCAVVTLIELIADAAEAHPFSGVRESETIYHEAPAAQFVVDESLRLQRVNRRVAELTGLPEAAHAGRSLRDIAPAFARHVEPIYQHVLASGEAILDAEIEGAWREGMEGPGARSRYWLTSHHPLRDTQGRVVAINTVLQDVSEQRRAQARLEAEHGVTRILGRARSLHAVGAELLNTLMPCVGAAYAALWRVDAAQQVLVPLVAAHDPQGVLESFARLTRRARYGTGMGVVGRAWAARAPSVVDDITQDDQLPLSREAAAAGLRSAAAFPIDADGECVGVIEFYMRETGHVDAKLLEMMGVVGSEIGQFIHRQRAEQAVRALVENTPDIVARFDLQCRHLYINRAISAVTGQPSTSFVGKTNREMGMPAPLCDTWEAAIDEVFTRGQELTLDFEYPSMDGTRYFQSRLVPERAEDGEVHSVLGVSRDQTEQRHIERERHALYQREQSTRRELEETLAALAEREQALQFLADATIELTSSLEYEAIPIKTADLMVPRMADWCTVDLLEADEWRRLAVRHVDPDKFALAYALSRHFPASADADVGPRAVAHTGQTQWAAEVSDDAVTAYARSEEHLQVLRKLNVGSYISVPLCARERTLGVLTAVRGSDSPPFTERDVQFMEELARRAGLAMDNALLYQTVQLELAERTRAEQALRDNEDNLGFILEAAQVGTWSWDIPSGRMNWCVHMESVYGLAPHSFGGTVEEFLRHIHPEDREQTQWALQQAIEGREDYLIEHRLMPRESAVRWVEGKGRVLYDANGQPMRMAGICTDVTARRHVEQALRLSEERFLTALKSTSVVVFNQDRDLRYTWLHDPNGHLSRGRVVLGRRDIEIMALDDAGLVETLKRRVLENGASLRQEIRISEDRNDHYYDLTVEPVRNGRGSIIGITGAMVDITHHMRLEATLREQAEQLAVADKRKDEFLAMLAHELRNPLAPIQNAVQVLRMHHASLNDTARWGLDIIARQGNHLTRLVDDMLDVARITRGRIELQKQALALADLVQGAVESGGPLVEAHGHTLSLSVSADMVCVEADATRMVQVLGNLLNNAAKYTPRGGEISVCARREGPHAVIRIKDTGIGISPDLLPRVFDLFTQGERSLDRSEGGLGLGLTLVRTLVEMHGGDVTVQSEGLGAGSEFIVRLPVFVPLQHVPSVAPVENADADVRRVLVVDDNEDVGQSLVMLLGAMGHEVQLTADGVEALACAETFLPQIVFLDVGLPGMDGFEVARRLRARHPDQPMLLVAFTGYGQEEMAQRAQDAGFDRHVLKPASFEVLEQLVREAPADP